MAASSTRLRCLVCKTGFACAIIALTCWRKWPTSKFTSTARLRAAEIREFGADAVVIATGSQWRRDGQGASLHHPISIAASAGIHTPDDLFAGTRLSGRVLIYDDEHYMMGGALAEKLLAEGSTVTYLTPQLMVSAWTVMTDEQEFIQKKLSAMGLQMVFSQTAESIDSQCLTSRCTYSGKTFRHEFDHLVLVTGRSARHELFDQLDVDATRIGDCLVPSSIADAVYSGHKFAREFDAPPASLLCRRERALLQPLNPDPDNLPRRLS